MLTKRKETLVLPSELPPGDDGVVVGERLLADAGLDLAQQAARAPVGARARARAGVRARFGGGGAQEAAGSAPRVTGARTFGDHDAVVVVVVVVWNWTGCGSLG